MEEKKKGGSCIRRDMVSWDVGVSGQLQRPVEAIKTYQAATYVFVVLTNGLLFLVFTLVDSRRVR